MDWSRWCQSYDTQIRRKDLGDIFAVSDQHCRMRRDSALVVHPHKLGKCHSPGAPLAVTSARTVVASAATQKLTSPAQPRKPCDNRDLTTQRWQPPLVLAAGRGRETNQSEVEPHLIKTELRMN